jgi:dTDP-4-amino-4,6-dideoxygalactose transaminase
VKTIPLVDLFAQHAEIAGELQTALERLYRDSDFILGGAVDAFEAAFAAFSGVSQCVAVGSGTDALEIILRASGIKAGDDVIVPTNTFIATAFAVTRCGANPVFVDCDPAAYLIDPEQVARRLGPRTKAVIAVHLYGQVAPMESLRAAIPDDRVLWIEDAAQAHGAARNGIPAGGFGAAGALSFYPAKNLGAYGDGGAVITNSEDLAQRMRALRNYGSRSKYEHVVIGYNSRLDTLQAIVLNTKLRHLAAWNAARRVAAQRYDDLLSDVEEVVTPPELPGNEHVWHLYVVRVPRRDRVLQRLREAGVGAAVHYPIPIHLQEAFRHLGHRLGDFPVAEACSQEILSLPLYPHITAEQQEYVVAELRKALLATAREPH